MGSNNRVIGVPEAPLEALPKEWVIEHRGYVPEKHEERFSDPPDPWYVKEQLEGRVFNLVEGFALLRVLQLQEHHATMRLRNDTTNETLQYQS